MNNNAFRLHVCYSLTNKHRQVNTCTSTKTNITVLFDTKAQQNQASGNDIVTKLFLERSKVEPRSIVFSRGWRKQTMNAGKRSIRETITQSKKITHRK